ncbi:Putative glycosyltransferase EpsD [uncultured bacterium]|nr:Putative glycosyltransferase EpsD [uncultured bacterium]
MKVLIYGLNYAPELTGIGKYTGEMSSWLAAQGHEVRVVTAPPYYPAWKINEGYSGKSYRTERIDGVKVSRCPLWVPSRPSGLKRILHLFSFAVSSLPVVLAKSLFWRPDVVFSVEPAIFAAPGAWAAARVGGAKAWLHVQDFELDAAFDMGIIRGKRIKSLVIGIEKLLMKRFDIVSTISPRMMDKLSEKGIEGRRRFLFPNWVDTDSIFPQPRQNSMRAELGIPPEAAVMLYSGNMGEKQGLDIILEAARLLSERKDLLFVLCGDGAARARLVERAKGLPHVRFIDLQPMEKLNDLLNMADVHLMPQRADIEDLVMPSKLPGIFASGRPVVATAHEGTQIARAVAGRGVVVRPGDARAFAEAISALSAAPELRKKLGDGGRDYCLENWGKLRVLALLEEKMKDIARA